MTRTYIQCIYIYIYIYTHTHTHTYTYIHTHINTYLYTSAECPSQSCKLKHRRKQSWCNYDTYIHTYIHTYNIQSIHTCIHTHTWIHTHTYVHQLNVLLKVASSNIDANNPDVNMTSLITKLLEEEALRTVSVVDRLFMRYCVCVCIYIYI